jgi:uncharacterized protein (DUF305 family)
MTGSELVAPHVLEESATPGGGVSRLTLVLLVLTIVLAAAVVALLIFRPRDPGDGSAEAGFARDMSTHHAQAVEMASIVHDRTNDESLKVLTTDIVLGQQDQIGQMEGWLNLWDLSQTGSEPAMAWMGHPMEGRMPGMASPEEVASLRTLPVDDMNEEFLRLMIAHHEAGIEMAQGILQRTDVEQVELLATSIVNAQRGEIDVMNEMLAEFERESGSAGAEATPGATPAATGTPHDMDMDMD